MIFGSLIPKVIKFLTSRIALLGILRYNVFNLKCIKEEENKNENEKL